MSKRLSAGERKNQIIEKASMVFAQKGYKGARTKEIAEACGITEPVLYQHFKNKEDIFFETQKIGRKNLIKYWGRITDESPNALAAYKRIMVSLAEYMGAHPVMASVIIQGMGVVSSNKKFGKITTDWFNEQTKFYYELLEKGLEDGSIKPGTDIEYIGWLIRGLFWVLVASATMRFKAGLDADKAIEYIERILSSISNDAQIKSNK